MILTILAFLSLGGWLYLAFGHGNFWQPVVDTPASEPKNWPSVDIVVPARDEAKSLPKSLPTLLTQDYPGNWRIVLVDDHSSDGTGEIARQLAFTSGRADKLIVLPAPELSEGWSGKVAAMQAGVSQGKSDYILFTDADIAHPKKSLRKLVARAMTSKLDLVSLMVKLRSETPVEKFLIPAFVFFFSMLFPFRRVNDPQSTVAAAAGGVMLVRRQALKSAGGLARIKPAIIDDCAMARIIKDNGGDESTPGNISLTLTQEVKSLRDYPALRDVTAMIARTAFTQLRYSATLLLGAMAGLGILFIVPMLAPLVGPLLSVAAGLASWLLLAWLYWPMVRFYGLPWFWSLTLPIAVVIYMAATLESALRYWQGKGGQWKGRVQAR